MTDLQAMGERAVSAKYALQKVSAQERDNTLREAAKLLSSQAPKILDANEEDIRAAQESGMHPGMIDRLRLTKERIEAMAEGTVPDCRAAPLCGGDHGAV